MAQATNGRRRIGRVSQRGPPVALHVDALRRTCLGSLPPVIGPFAASPTLSAVDIGGHAQASHLKLPIGSKSSAVSLLGP
jgi:hypothetical protein